jgi:hypothetical protein
MDQITCTYTNNFLRCDHGASVIDAITLASVYNEISCFQRSFRLLGRMQLVFRQRTLFYGHGVQQRHKLWTLVMSIFGPILEVWALLFHQCLVRFVYS